jgi:membrane associated rhomboid family serine protease
MTGESPLDRFRRWYAVLPPAMRLLLTVNTVAFVAWWFISLSRGASGFVAQHLALNTVPPGALLEPWQLVTYGFLSFQTGLWGLIGFAFSQFWLYWLGRDYEEFYGSHRLLGLYLFSAVGGAVVAVALGAVLPGVFGGILDGVWAAVLGVLCAAATLNPDRGIGLFLLGVIPLKWIAIGFLVLDVLFSLAYPARIASHVGAAGAGVLFILAQQRGTDLAAWARFLFQPRGERRRSSRAREPEREGVLTRVSSWAPKRKAEARKAEFEEHTAAATSDDLDRILDKMLEHGKESLSEEEWRVLNEASRKR